MIDDIIYDSSYNVEVGVTATNSGTIFGMYFGLDLSGIIPAPAASSASFSKARIINGS